jgi:hypothetical protein
LKKWLILLGCVLLAAACGRPATGYPAAYELNFMQACEARSTVPGLCACTWDKIEAEVAPADFAALERLPAAERETHPLKRQIDDYALACARELSAPSP